MRYLKCASLFWNSLESNGTGNVTFGQLNLTGTDESLNIFRLDSANLYGSGLSLSQLNGINIIAVERDHQTNVEFSPQYRFAAEDIIAVIGKVDKIDHFEQDIRP